MDIKNLILIIISGIYVILVAAMLMRNFKSPIITSFSLVVLGAALWVFSLAMFNETLEMNEAEAWAKIYYFASAVIMVAFMFFANNFPYKLFDFSENKILFIFLPFLAITVVIFHPTLLIEKAAHFEWGNDANEKLLGHILYAIYFFSFLIAYFAILFRKLKKSEGFVKALIVKIIMITFISFSFGFTFDLILPIIGNYKLIWVGPYFTVVTIFYVAYLIFHKDQKKMII